MRSSEPISLAQALPSLPKPTGPGRLSDEWIAADLAARRHTDAIAAAQTAFPANLRETDWKHPSLLPYASQIATVRAWRPLPGQPYKGLLLSGPSGRGKTRALAALVLDLAHLGHRVHAFRSVDWFSRLQAQIRYGDEGDAPAFVSAFARVPILLLDDLGQQALTTARSDWAQGKLFDLLDQRLANGLPLLVSTNLTSQQLADSATDKTQIRGDPLVRRLIELCVSVRF